MMFSHMGNDRPTEGMSKKQKNLTMRTLHQVENRFISRKNSESSLGTRVTVKQFKLKYSKVSGFFEAI
ncbi:hypothetical protein NEAUS03_0518 [Nematocida ausubeli]|nr:hypothetical protein NEAUS03_0518 [Nematocida ausubeli]